MTGHIMKRLLLSRFLRVIERNGLVVLLHQLRPEPIFLSKLMWHDITKFVTTGRLINCTNDLMTNLEARKLLVDSPSVDRKVLETVRGQTNNFLNRPTILYLMMAQGCNFSCTYCPIPALAEQYGPRLLSFEDAVAGISLWKKHIEEYPKDDDPYFLIFYGGEPLLNRGILERLLAYVSKEHEADHLPRNLNLMLCTNGSLIDKQFAELLIRHQVTVAIGIDGPQADNDRVRITRDGGPTFNDLKRVIAQLVENDIRVVASVTITPENVSRLAEYPEFLQKLGIAQFGFNLMKGHALRRELDGRDMDNYCRSAARGVLSGLAKIDETGSCYEYQLEKKLSALRQGLPYSVDCTCYGNQLVIQADGQVSNCPFLRIDQGHVRALPDAFRIGMTETVETWRKRLALFDDEIMANNSADFLDGGGCAWNSFELYGDVFAQDRNNAVFTQEVMYELIWTLLPADQARAIREGETTHWCYRWIGDMHIAGVGDN